MKVKDALLKTRTIHISRDAHPVEQTVASEFIRGLCPQAMVEGASLPGKNTEGGRFHISVMDRVGGRKLFPERTDFPGDREWVGFHVEAEGGGFLAASQPSFLYMAFSALKDSLLENDISVLKHWLRSLTFAREKSTFDLFLTQYARLIRDFERESYIREYARLGFTHIEVNALAHNHPAEEGVEGEFYPEFYTYCPSLDQFVSSRLNRGLYAEDYLASNLALLKKNAELAVRYGLIPGLLCFEPRSVPESFFRNYPTLRGARVDHPFRSFKPRYSLALAHPVVKKHYREMIANLLAEVPQLGFLTVWSNDSGAGFEHTRSLYVGRNGGAYLIREWKTDDEIAAAASRNILDFFRLLRETGESFHPGFRLITRLESYYGERRFLWPGLREGIDVEANSLLTQGWESVSFHPRYSDIPVLGSALHNCLQSGERKPWQELRKRNSHGYFYHFFSSHGNHEPLLGIPFPWLVYEKLRSAADIGIDSLAHVGGLQPPDKVRCAVNQEVFRRFQLDDNLDIERTIAEIAEEYAGIEYAPVLIRGWKLLDQSVRSFVPLSIYTHYGVVWQRLFVRPLVPDIDGIPEEERAYYENFMCTSVHNPNRIDLGQDVLFRLVTMEYAQKAVGIIDANVWDSLEEAIGLFGRALGEQGEEKKSESHEVLSDFLTRAKALRCLFKTIRNTAVWIAAVHRYVGSLDPGIRAQCRIDLAEMIDSEIENTRALLELWAESNVEWLIVSGAEETPFIYGENFPALLEKRIGLMKRHRDDEPRLDPEYMFRVENDPYKMDH